MKTTKTTKRTGLIAANPAEFLIHQRLGKTLFAGRDRAAFILPLIDRFYLIPSSVHSVAFKADQITAENQGVEIEGFAIWNIARPKQAVEAMDFTDPDAAIANISTHLREVVEAAVRNELANLTLEDALRERGKIIERMKNELADVAQRWGLDITTVEIKTVTIMSQELFENMQSPFRNTIRLQSERSTLETDEQIAKENSTVKEQQARREMEFKAAEAKRQTTLRKTAIEQEAELERLRAEKKTETELACLDAALELKTATLARQRQIADAEKDLVAIDRELDHERFVQQRQRSLNEEVIATIEEAVDRLRIETANTRDTTLLLMENLPAIASNLKLGEVTLGDPLLARVLGDLLRTLTPHNNEQREANP